MPALQRRNAFVLFFLDYSESLTFDSLLALFNKGLFFSIHGLFLSHFFFKLVFGAIDLAQIVLTLFGVCDGFLPGQSCLRFFVLTNQPFFLLNFGHLSMQFSFESIITRPKHISDIDRFGLGDGDARLYRKSALGSDRRSSICAASLLDASEVTARNAIVFGS